MIKSEDISAVEAVSWIAFNDFNEIKNHLRTHIGLGDFEKFGTTHDKPFLRKFVRAMEKNQPLPAWHRYYFTTDGVKEVIARSGKSLHEFRACLIQADRTQKRSKIGEAINKFLKGLRDDELSMCGISNEGDGSVESVPIRFLKRQDIALGLHDNVLRILTLNHAAGASLYGKSPQAIRHIAASNLYLKNNAVSDCWGKLEVKREDVLRLWRKEKVKQIQKEEIKSFALKLTSGPIKLTKEKIEADLQKAFPGCGISIGSKFFREELYPLIKEKNNVYKTRGRPKNQSAPQN